MASLKYVTILKCNQALGKTLKTNPYDIAVLSNITIHPIKEICEYYLREEGINAQVRIGDYDNIVQDSFKYAQSKLVIIFWELCNIIHGMQYKAELYDSDQLESILEKTKKEIDLVLKNLATTSLVLFNTFSSLPVPHSSVRKTNLEKLGDQLNRHLAAEKPNNVHLVDIEKVIAYCGVKNSFDYRFYYSSQALYAIEFFKSYAKHIKPYVMSANGKNKKALIFDCDNTLWKGILGEDGFDKIEMSPATKDGAIFSEIQGIALALNKQGILLGLCSKNNPEDVDQVITSHPDMQLRDKHNTINKSNWNDKATNLLAIATELNIGVDSLVFVDDSPFEVSLIRQQLPEVTVIQVPERLCEYPRTLRKKLGLFYNPSLTAEDSEKPNIYKQQLRREESKKKFTDIEEYLASLKLKVRVHVDNEHIIPRISQMSQKTNQFNLTTKRYTENDIRNFIVNPSSIVFAFSVVDRFGDNGVTGMAIVTIDKKHLKTADIDTFLMSCRIIGRNVEYAFMDYLIDYLRAIGMNTVRARYSKTSKNEQVYNFLDKCSFCLTDSDGRVKNYSLDIGSYKPKKLNYIEVTDGG